MPRWPLYNTIQSFTPINFPMPSSTTKKIMHYLANCTLSKNSKEQHLVQSSKFIKDSIIHQGSKQMNASKIVLNDNTWECIHRSKNNLHLLAKHQSIQNLGNVYQIIGYWVWKWHNCILQNTWKISLESIHCMLNDIESNVCYSSADAKY